MRKFQVDNETKCELWFHLSPSYLFWHYWKERDHEVDGVMYVVGISHWHQREIQSIRFDKNLWNVKTARAWVKKNAARFETSFSENREVKFTLRLPASLVKSLDEEMREISKEMSRRQVNRKWSYADEIIRRLRRIPPFQLR